MSCLMSLFPRLHLSQTASCTSQLANSVSQLCQCLFQDTTLRADIQAHEAVSRAASRYPVECLSAKEYLAVVKGQAGLVDEEAEETVVVKPQLPAVEPYEERCLGSQRLYLRDIP